MINEEVSESSEKAGLEDVITLEVNPNELQIILDGLKEFQIDYWRRHPITLDMLGKGPIWDLIAKLPQSDKSLEGLDNELRRRDKAVVLENQSIIELAYLTKETIEAALGHRLCVEQANCYRACFYHIQEMLKTFVDQEYLAKHKRLVEFYKDDRVLSVDYKDRLHWITKKEILCLDYGDEW